MQGRPSSSFQLSAKELSYLAVAVLPGCSCPTWLQLSYLAVAVLP